VPLRFRYSPADCWRWPRAVFRQVRQARRWTKGTVQSGEGMVTDRRDELRALTRRRSRVAVVLTAAMMIIYFGFILLVAFRPELLATLIVPGLSLGILMGALVIVSAWLLTFIYVRWANTVYDDEVNRLRR